MNRIRSAEPEDLQRFLALADDEGWRIPQLERRLFAQGWRPSALALVSGELFCGFVTAVAYPRSGWIGNLIIPQGLRGRGYGSMLFQAALDSLEEQEVASVWLTASEMGRPLYARQGFTAVDQIERWVGRKRGFRHVETSALPCTHERLRESDRNAWEDDRSALLEALAGAGRTYACQESVACLQAEPGMQIIGPWYSPSNSLHDNRLLLDCLLAHADPNLDIVVDLLASSAVCALLAENGFHRSGVTTLMARGEGTQVDLGAMVSLASLGSIG